jgi:hypothetical protein
LANGNGRDLIGWSVTDCEQAALIGEGALRMVYDSHINRTGPMTTTTLPTMTDRANHFLISADGQELVRFCDSGHHQMMVTRFAIEAGEWEPQSGGFNWTGLVRKHYQALTAKGYRKAA